MGWTDKSIQPSVKSIYDGRITLCPFDTFTTDEWVKSHIKRRNNNKMIQNSWNNFHSKINHLRKTQCGHLQISDYGWNQRESLLQSLSFYVFNIFLFVKSCIKCASRKAFEKKTECITASIEITTQKKEEEWNHVVKLKSYFHFAAHQTKCLVRKNP